MSWGDRNTLVLPIACSSGWPLLTLYRGKESICVGIEGLGSLCFDILVIGAKGLETGRGYWSSEVGGLGTKDPIESIALAARHPRALAWTA